MTGEMLDFYELFIFSILIIFQIKAMINVIKISHFIFQYIPYIFFAGLLKLKHLNSRLRSTIATALCLDPTGYLQRPFPTHCDTHTSMFDFRCFLSTGLTQTFILKIQLYLCSLHVGLSKSDSSHSLKYFRLYLPSRLLTWHKMQGVNQNF